MQLELDFNNKQLDNCTMKFDGNYEGALSIYLLDKIKYARQGMENKSKHRSTSHNSKLALQYQI